MKYLLLTLLKAFLAGMCISFGGTVSLLSDSKVLGALFFTCGLFFILVFGLDLFTGKICYLFSKDRDYSKKLPVIWIGNFAGAFGTALLLKLTRQTAALAEKAYALCLIKAEDSLLSLLVLGFFCNIFIYFAVEGFQRIEFIPGKYIALFFGVMVFVLSGYEHCVADMFYFSAAGMLDAGSVLRLLVITAGNSAGGIFAHELIGKVSALKEMD